MLSQMNHPELQVVILAAGKGTRMRSRTPKVLHPLLGRSMLEHVLHTIESLRPKGISVIVGYGSEEIQNYIGSPRGLKWVYQAEQLGTAHAVKQARISCKDCKHTLILCADTPLISSPTLADLIQSHEKSGSSISLLSAELSPPAGYGRIVRDGENNVRRVVEDKEASSEEKNIHEVNSGIYCADTEILFDLLDKVANQNEQREYYLPDILAMAIAGGHAVQAKKISHSYEIQGVNDRKQLADAEQILQQQVVNGWQDEGVTIEQPHTVRIEYGVHIGSDTVIKAGTQLLGSTHIGDDCVVGPYSIIEDAWLDDRVVVHPFSHVFRARCASGVSLGPYARLRPGAELDENSRIGNFVEIKQAVIGRNSKVNHLSYVGDTVMGDGCNVGAGTITCNYDGANKHQTTIGDRVFIGSDTKLVAPVEVEDDATIGAGSIITKKVHSGGLTLSARPEQRHRSAWKRPEKKK